MDKLCLTIFYAYFLSYALGFVDASEKITSCAQTPHPQVCNHFINTTLLQSTNTTHFSFRDQSILATLNQAILAHKKISSINKKTSDKKSKLALADCLELYEDSIDLLNRSLSSSDLSDSQTWLGAAIANQQTCEDGFIDFKLGHRLKSKPFSYMTNFTKLISNSLAVNKAFFPASSKPCSTKNVGGRRLLRLLDGFPWWVSGADWRILQGAAPKADIVVAQDGSGDYKTISEAVKAMGKKRKKGSGRFVVYVKKGIYKENVEMKGSMKNIMFIGDGIDATIVTGSRSHSDATTFSSATFGVSGENFIAKDMTFENTAGPKKHQAVAFRSNADKSVFYGCSFKGYQDTLYVHVQRQFYRNCDIYGTIDFIFGDAQVILQNCNIYVRKPMSSQKNTITAQSRHDPNEMSGIIIQNSRVTAAPDLRPVQKSFKTFLGRPWKKYARTVIIKSNLDNLIDPAGWYPWDGNFALSSLYYGEYMNTGSGASTGGRVKWPGFHVLTKASDVEKFTVGNYLNGGSWIQNAGVPFNFGL